MVASARGIAPGKIILFGEHAVVYGRPAIAVPIRQVQALATVQATEPGAGLTLIAKDLNRVISYSDVSEDDPLGAIVRLTLSRLQAPPPDATVTIRSSIPIASGLGSGAAVSTAIVRGLMLFLGRQLAPEVINQLVFEVEKLYHGTPSGIDNTVVVFGRPVYYVRAKHAATFDVGAPLDLLIGDTGVASSTRVAVGKVRSDWERDQQQFERLFSEIGELVVEAKALIEAGSDRSKLGKLMDRNHDLLVTLGVSSPELQHLVQAARVAGAIGAKLSGAGLGGNLVALVRPEDSTRVAKALCDAGAVRVIATQVPATATGHQS